MGLLHQAAKSGDLAQAKEVLIDPESDALEEGIHTKDLHDQTVVHLASKYGNLELFEKNSWNVKSNLYSLRMVGHSNILEWALQAGCEINAQTVAGDTPLILATQTSQTSIIKLLTTKRADANDHGNTALHYACFWRNLEVALHLQSCGALVRVKNKHGKTPLQLTSESIALKLGELAVAVEDTVVEAKARSTTHVMEENKARFMVKAAVGWEIPSTNAVLFLEPRGKTQYAEVHKGQWTNYTVAIKRLLDQQMADDEIKAIRTEISAIRKLQHPNIAAIRAACATPPYVTTLIEWADKGTLKEFLHNPNQEMDQDFAMKIAKSVANGMAYLHSQTPSVHHLNLKSSNVLVMSDYTVKVSEYGYNDSPLLSRNKNQQQLFHPESIAPELLRNITDPNIDYAAADVYSYGILLFEIVTRTPPYEGMNPMHIGIKVLLEGARPALPEYVPTELSELIQQCWTDLPADRPSFSEIVQILSQFNTSEDSRPAGIDDDAPVPLPKKVPRVINNRPAMDSEDELSTDRDRAF
ncbi:hypothetical protein SmJEL517_g04077 [Synchytrium microbalum]|uniref:Protein kinase domain-containing protein n=1 Tax=Synchytrium microbalum TaxID=1806994 RepID=A0A507C435_9FUNG|nr:uncharacterized protein SmJEL517_g04077 [Synchytrium microbalum]TPX32874.1 hypothetical protein SmJEL517_g04077 [Synchytrium microbalum]